MYFFSHMFIPFWLALSYHSLTVRSRGVVFNFDLTTDMRTADFDDPNSPLSKLIAYVVKGFTQPKTTYLSIHSRQNFVEMGIEIRDSSIFCPGENTNNCQHGFRRTDVLPAIDKTTALSGTTVFYQSFRTNSRLPLNLDHGYLLASIEIPVSDHVFDIFTGVQLGGSSQYNGAMIRVRDLNTKVLYATPLRDNTLYNFAIAVDWNSNTLTVYASQGDNQVVKVAGPAPNDPKVIAAENVQKGEWHAQLIKFPIPNPQDSPERQQDVPHYGQQESNIHEGVYFSRMYVEKLH
ncbi:hypothetical protein DFH28DRAFT_890238 [Melampsora americana]|nr:hypothetical protein DFH28DRAFT_890238 [Melampsora americana]